MIQQGTNRLGPPLEIAERSPRVFVAFRRPVKQSIAFVILSIRVIEIGNLVLNAEHDVGSL